MEYLVDGMTCNGCANAIKNAFKSIDDTLVISVDLATKTVSIDGNITPTHVQETVENAGFDFLGEKN